MAGLNLSALKQTSASTPMAGLTIQSEASSTAPAVSTPMSTSTTSSTTVAAPVAEKAPEKPRANKISLATLRGDKTPANNPAKSEPEAAVAQETIMTEASPVTENQSMESLLSPQIEESVVETPTATPVEETIVAAVSEETTIETDTSANVTSEEVASTESSVSIMPAEEAIVSTPAPTPIELPKEFFPGLTNMDELEDVEGDILKLESDVHMSEVVIERAIQGDLTAPEIEAAKVEAAAQTVSPETSEEIVTAIEVATAPSEEMAAIETPMETSVEIESVESAIIAEDAIDTTETSEEIVIIDAADMIVVETSGDAIVENTIAPVEISTATTSETIPTTETTAVQPEIVENTANTNDRPAPEYVSAVKGFLSGTRLGGFRYLSGRNGYVIAGVGVATVLGVAAWVVMDHLPKPTEFAPTIKTSITDIAGQTKPIEPKTSEPIPQPNYSAGQDYTVIKNTKKNRKNAPTQTPTDGQPMPPAPTPDAGVPAPVAPPVDTVSDMPPAPTLPTTPAQ